MSSQNPKLNVLNISDSDVGWIETEQGGFMTVGGYFVDDDGIRRHLSELDDEQEVSKGDVVGHGFHGNQYTGGINGSGAWKPTMTLAEAQEWAKNSAIQVPLYHGTNRPESIMAEGFRDNKGGGNLINGTWVNDFNPREVEGETKWGLYTLKVMANVHSIATPEQYKAIWRRVEELQWNPHDHPINAGDEARKIATEQGFDALHLKEHVYVILNPKNLVVISDEIQKGDVLGHDFRGNQYSDVQASGDGWVLVPRGGKGGDAPKPREPKVTTLRIRPTAAVKPSAAARALEPPTPPDAGSPQKIEPRGGFVALTSTDIVKNLGDKEALGGYQNKGFQRVLLADGTIGTLKTGVLEEDMRREMVAVTVAKALDLPTIESVPIKEENGLRYSLLMPWIEQDPAVVPREIAQGTSGEDEARERLRDVNPPEFDRAELLHALTGNVDDHMGNYMTTKDPVTDEVHIIPIDNAIRGRMYKGETMDAVEQLGLSTAEIQRMDAGIESILQTRANWCDAWAQRDLMEIHDSWKSILPAMLAKASQR